MSLRGSTSAVLSQYSRQLCTKTLYNTLYGPVRARARVSPPNFPGATRSYALSRSNDGTRHPRFGSATSMAKQAQRAQQRKGGVNAVPEAEAVWTEQPGQTLYDHQTVIVPGEDSTAEAGLKRLLEVDTVVVVRQLEMLNIFLGYEQANKYALLDPVGNPVGFMAEEERGFLSTLQRQVFRTHRPFKSTILDTEGNVVLKVNRPFAWINSRTFVQRHVLDENAPEEDTVVGEVQQVWHPWRRKYNLFTGRQGDFSQFAAVDMPFLSWDFFLQDEANTNIASVVRNFTGFGREIFTDTGQYVISFRPDPAAPSVRAQMADGRQTLTIHRPLSLEERAVGTSLNYEPYSDTICLTRPFSLDAIHASPFKYFFWWLGVDHTCTQHDVRHRFFFAT
ncbi:Scramblase-domain-containing protein [Clavulina sp. PMI_390]|nr:Scramblase-domain-containing protein [Clavulina sp. PMI_390]